jgi:hypothetical protein
MAIAHTGELKTGNASFMIVSMVSFLVTAFTVHFISIKPVLSNHLSFVTTFDHSF